MDSSRNERAEHNFGVDLAHDFAGALLFACPLLMTMEMWWLGFYVDRLRLALFLALAFACVLGLSYLEGEEQSFKMEVLDALVAYAVGYLVAAALLFLFGVLQPGMAAEEVIGKITLQAVPCSIGAILARKLLEVETTHKEQRRRQGQGAKVLLMGVGAVFLAFPVAPTEEMVLIAVTMPAGDAAVLALVALGILQAFGYALEQPQKGTRRSVGFWGQVFLRFTSVGFALAFGLSLYMLWTFGRLEGVALVTSLKTTLVLSFPAAVGAAAARLIL